MFLISFLSLRHDDPLGYFFRSASPSTGGDQSKALRTRVTHPELAVPSLERVDDRRRWVGRATRRLGSAPEMPRTLVFHLIQTMFGQMPSTLMGSSRKGSWLSQGDAGPRASEDMAKESCKPNLYDTRKRSSGLMCRPFMLPLYDRNVGVLWGAK
jgi:hypothetical protein